MDNMDLLKLIVFEACEDGRVDDFDKQDMLNFINEAVNLKSRKETSKMFDNAISVNKKENLKDNDVHTEYAIVVKIGSGKILFDYHSYDYGTICNKTISKKAALERLMDKYRDVGLFQFGISSNTHMSELVGKLYKEYNTGSMSSYEWAQKVAKVKNKCSLMSPEFKKECDKVISNYK